MTLTRREFLGKTGAAALGVYASTNLLSGYPSSLKPGISGSEVGYGPLRKDRLSRLDLPRGFRYKLISEVGDKMDDGFYVPGLRYHWPLDLGIGIKVPHNTGSKRWDSAITRGNSNEQKSIDILINTGPVCLLL